jgi:hypothetical protein
MSNEQKLTTNSMFSALAAEMQKTPPKRGFPGDIQAAAGSDEAA